MIEKELLDNVRRHTQFLIDLNMEVAFTAEQLKEIGVIFNESHSHLFKGEKNVK